MIKYRGYYIDGVVFKTKEDIDTFVRDTIIKKAKQFIEMLASGRYNACEMMKISEEISIREKRLMKILE